jgi:hypothetical protein
MGAKINIRSKEISVMVKESVADIIEIIQDIITDSTQPNFICLTQDDSYIGELTEVGDKFIVNINDIILIRNNGSK